MSAFANASAGGISEHDERSPIDKALATAGVVLAAPLGRRSRLAAAVAGAALVASSALTRFGIFAAGMESARDPQYTVEPQRPVHGRAAAPTAA